MARNTLDNVTPLRPGLTATANVLSTAPADDRHIPFIDLQAQRKRLGQGIEDAIARVLDHGRFVAGPEIDELRTNSVRGAAPDMRFPAPPGQRRCRSGCRRSVRNTGMRCSCRPLLSYHPPK